MQKITIFVLAICAFFILAILTAAEVRKSDAWSLDNTDRAGNVDKQVTPQPRGESVHPQETPAPGSPGRAVQPQQISSKDLHSLQSIAISLGTSRGAAEKMNISEVILEIQGRIKESEPIPSTTLTDGNLKDLESFLADDPKMLQKIQVYDRFIKGLAGKRILKIQPARQALP